MCWPALSLLIVALARPQKRDSQTVVRESGVDIVVAIDLSGSMASEEFQLQGKRASRLAVAKDALQTFIIKRRRIASG